MNKLKFQPTHRVLIKAKIGTHGYDMVSIDVDHGTFYRCNVDSADTKIRAKKGILAEKLCYNGGNDYNLPLTDEKALEVVEQLNIKRAELGFHSLEFWRFEENDN